MFIPGAMGLGWMLYFLLTAVMIALALLGGDGGGGGVVGVDGGSGVGVHDADGGERRLFFGFSPPVALCMLPAYC